MGEVAERWYILMFQHRRIVNCLWKLIVQVSPEKDCVGVGDPFSSGHLHAELSIYHL